MVLRAEKLQLAERGAPANGSVTVDATVEAVDYQGQAVRYFVRAGERQLQAINMIDERPFLVVTGQLGKTELGRLIHNERWTADIGGIDEASLEFQVVAAVARNYR